MKRAKEEEGESGPRHDSCSRMKASESESKDVSEGGSEGVSGDVSKQAIESSMQNESIKITECKSGEKKLLIMDLNGVLLRKGGKKCKSITLRPHVHAFMRHMSGLFHLAVWTSGRADTMHKAMLALFEKDRYKEDLMFYWTQKECIYVPYNVDPDELADLIRPPKKKKTFKELKFQNGHVEPAAQVKSEFINGSFKKVLSHVFARFPSFHLGNTILLDDSSDKLSFNPPNTHIGPRPFAQQKVSSTAPAPNVVSTTSLPLPSINTEGGRRDDELVEGGRLWLYLVALASYHGPSNDFIRQNPYHYTSP